MTPFLLLSSEYGGAGVQFCIFASICWDSLSFIPIWVIRPHKSLLGHSSLPTQGLFGSDFSLLPSSTFTMSPPSQWCPGLSVTQPLPSSAFGASEDSHEWMLSAGFPGPFLTHPTTNGIFPLPGFYPGGKKSLNQWFSTSIGPIPQGVLQKFVDILIGCHMTGVILPMNFTLFQDSKRDFTKYLLPKAVVSFNRTKDHCHQRPLFPSPSQDELKKHGCRIQCYYGDPHLFPPPAHLTPPYPCLGKCSPVLEFRKAISDFLQHWYSPRPLSLRFSKPG